VKSYEHRSVGDAATGAAMVNTGGDSADEAFWLSFGDVVALSGDYFAGGTLFDVAPLRGQGGTRLGTRDEIVCALKVAAVDEDVPDPRFERDGRFGHFAFSPRADRTDVERAVRDRYLSLAAVNDDHFVAPGASGVRTGTGYPSAPVAYRHLHQTALDDALARGRDRGDLSQAMAREAAAQHYLTDAFAAGHLRTPVAAVRRYWKHRYPHFWDQLQRRVAADTAATLRKISRAMRLVPPEYVHRRTFTELARRTRGYPELSVGDLVARCLHDWDNAHGLALEGGGVIFGDGQIGDGVTTDLVLAAVRAGNDDVEVAYALGASGRGLRGQALYDAVRVETRAAGPAFVAETMIPRVAADNPPQNWEAHDIETLWMSPIIGACGTTFGDALAAMLDPDGQFIRQLDSLGEGLAGSAGVLALPVVGGWLSQKCCHAFHDGFVTPLASDPAPVLMDLVADPAHPPLATPRAGSGIEPHLGNGDRRPTGRVLDPEEHLLARGPAPGADDRAGGSGALGERPAVSRLPRPREQCADRLGSGGVGGRGPVAGHPRRVEGTGSAFR
jgi:hypothetical protein